MVRPTLSPGLYFQMVGRGFRLNPGKENCQVLDFGGNVLRHGPVDDLRIHERDGRGSGDAPAKECPECRSLIAAGFSICPDCGHEFPEPNRRKHDATASSEGILSGQVMTKESPVQDVRYFVHQKRGASENDPRTLRVEYRLGFNQYQSEWICFEHTGWARKKAESWWRKRSNAFVPELIEEAVGLAEAGALCPTKSITVRSVAGEEYASVIGYELGEKPAWREPGWDEEADESDVDPAQHGRSAMGA
jgi:DNA repair protein RadD